VDHDPESLHAALADAVAMRIIDLVQVLVNSGADIKSVSLLDVLLTWERAQLVFTDPPDNNVPMDGHASGNGSIRHREFAMTYGEKTNPLKRPRNRRKRANQSTGC
jgi:hypothetical protein